MSDFCFPSIPWEQNEIKPHGIVTCHFCKFITVMVLNWSLNFVSVQYLQNTFCRTWRNFAYALIQTSCDCSRQFSSTCNFRPLSDVRIPFPLDSVRTNGWNFTQFYIGKTFGGILPVCFHKFVTESWALVDIFTTWYALYRAIVWFSELDIVEACWPI